MEEVEAQAHPAEVAPAEEEEVHPTEAQEEAHPMVVEEAPAVDHPVEVSLPEDHPVEHLPEDHLVLRILHVTIGALAPARGTPVPARGTLEARGVQTLEIHQLKAIKDQRIMDTPRIPRHIPTLMDTAPAQVKV